MEKLVIIGSGIAGLTAAIYAAREQSKPLVIEGSQPGGQLATSSIVENWPGELKFDGREFMAKTREQAEANGARFLAETVTSVDLSGQPIKITTDNQTIETKGLIIATGSTHRKLGCPGEEEFFGKGVAVCATCDGPLQKDKEIVIVGSGDTAIEQAYFLFKYASKISMVFVGDEPTANDPLKNKVLDDAKLTLIPNSTVVEIKGSGDQVSGVTIEHEQTKEQQEVACGAVFLAIGMDPNTELFKDQINMDEKGYIEVDEWMVTSTPGVFACGDVVKNNYKQAITSAGQGCQAVLSFRRWESSDGGEPNTENKSDDKTPEQPEDKLEPDSNDDSNSTNSEE